MKNNLYVFFLFFITGLMSCSHHSGLYEHAEKIMSQHPDSVLTLLSTIQDVNDLSEKDRAMYYLLLTEAQNKTYVKPTSDSLIAISTEYFDKTEDWGRKAKAWYYRGRVNQDLGDALHAQDYYLKALRNSDKVLDYVLLGRISYSLGMLYTYQNVYEKAIPFQKKALDYFREVQDSIGQSFVLRDIGRTYTSLSKLDSACFFYEYALNYANNLSKPSIFSELGNVCMDLGDYKKAYDFLQLSLEYSTDVSLLYPTYLTLGDLFSRIGPIDSAYVYLEMCKESHSCSTQAGAYYYLAKLEKEQKHWKNYAMFQEVYEQLRDSTNKIKQTESIRKMQDLYNYHQVEAKYMQTQIALNKTIINFLIVGIFALSAIVILVFVIVMVYKRLNNKKKHLQEQRRKLDALKEKQRKDRERIEKNEKIIAKLEKQIQESSIAFDEKEKELMLLRKERLEAENKNLKYAETENELLLNRFLTSDIYYRFHMKEDWRPKENDWEELYKALDETYDGFTHRLMGVAKKLTSTELRVSCLVKSNVPPVTIAMLIVTTPTNVSMIRKRLYEKIHSQKGSSEKFDRFIQEF